MPNIKKFMNVKNIFNTCPVRKFCTRLWSPMRCSRSPSNFESKNDIGNFKSLMKKSPTSEILMRIEMCSSKLRRIKQVAVFPIIIINSPKRMSQIKLIFLYRTPKSTINCVRKGIKSWRIEPNNKVAIIKVKLLLCKINYFLPLLCHLLSRNIKK